jgi:hypothetical protein
MLRPPRRSLRRISVVGSALFGAALLALPAAPARAASPISSADLDCTITLTVDLNPGTTPPLRHIALTTHGFTATAECTGTVDGLTVTGPGTFALNEADIADCVLAVGHGEFILRVPTTSGTRTVAGTFTSVGTVLSGDLTGTGEVVALVGDCVTVPRTSVTAVDTVHIGP